VESDPELTIDEQVAHMRDAYPGFSLITTEPWIALWRGQLTPFAREYDVQVLYSAVSLDLAAIKAKRVHVEIHRPLLRPRADACIPHIYPNNSAPPFPRLCLHQLHEWAPSMIIADTIMPWTLEWLVAYEGWRATGTWFAGGHNTEREKLAVRRRS